MIHLDFFNAIAVYFIFLILALFGSWVFGRDCDISAAQTQGESLRQCPICSHLFFDYQDKSICVCPACKSYIKKGEEV